LLQLPFLLALVLTLSLLVNSGCYYYKATARPGFTAEQLNKLLKENRYMILHSGESVWHLSLLRVHGDRFTGYVDKVDPERVKYLPVPNINWQPNSPKIPTTGTFLSGAVISSGAITRTVSLWSFSGKNTPSGPGD
jgi:hypothetical protein